MRTTNPKRLWRDIEETANPKERLERVKQALARVRPELAALHQETRELESARTQFVNHPGKEAGAWHDARRLRLLAWLLLFLDIPIQYLLNSSALSGVASWKVALGSIALPLGIAGAVHYLGEQLLYDKDRPKRSVRITKVLAAVSFLATAAGATVFLFARQAGESAAAYLITLTAASLWTVAEALPLTSGFVSAWAHMLARPGLDEQRLNEVREQVATHERFVDRLQQEETGLTVSSDAHRDAARPVDRVATRALPFLTVLLLMSVAGTGALSAQTPPGLCALFVDRTVSVDSAHRAEAVRLLSRSLPGLVHSLRCRELVVGAFADEGPFAPRRWFTLPDAPGRRDCATVRTETPGGATGLLVNLKGFRDHFAHEAALRCEREDSTARQGYEIEMRKFLADTRGLLEQPPLARATKTDVIGLLQSLIESGVTLALLVTDGIDTAHDGAAGFTVPQGTRIVLLLVPARESDGGQEATSRAAAHWRAAGVMSVPYTVLIAPAGWVRLGSAPPDRP